MRLGCRAQAVPAPVLRDPVLVPAERGGSGTRTGSDR